MKYYIGKPNSTSLQFDTLSDFLDAVADLATAYAENGEDHFEIEVAVDAYKEKHHD